MKRSKLSRRKFLQFSTTVAAGAFLAGCPAPAPSSSGAGNAPAAEAVSIIYYDRTKDLTQWADAYNDSQEAVTVEVELQPPGTRYEQLVAAVVAGNAPDVIGLDCVQVGRFVQLDALVDLSDLIPADVQDRYFQNLMTTERHYGIFEGKLVGVPFWVDCSVCIYNKAMLEEAGGDPESGFRTWDDHVTYGKEIAKNEDMFGFATGRVNQFLFGPWVWAQGGDFTDLDWTKSRCDEPPVRNMYEFARAIVTEHQITNDAPATDWGTMNELFQSQKAMAVYGGGGSVGLIRNQFPELFEVLGTCPIPGPEEGQISSFIGGNVASISKQSEHLEASLDFVLWATIEEDGLAVTAELGHLPGGPEGFELAAYQENWNLFEALSDSLEFGFPAANDPRFDEVSLTPLNLAWEQSIIGEISMDEIIDTLHTTIDGILQR
ncbi:substrate-binding domain-containing protein [Chloroflexi bacterium TSY]|nr:substrate-binding domain-containing protein [Chloroflexi bacterium TSY]